MTLPENLGTRLSIDETCLHNGEVYTLLSSKKQEGMTSRSVLAAAVQSTIVDKVSTALEDFPLEARLRVEEVTMDFSNSMLGIARRAFPNAMIVIDCFHITKLIGTALEDIRSALKRKARRKEQKAARTFRDQEQRHLAALKVYDVDHPCPYSGKKRGRKPLPARTYSTPRLANGDTIIELLTRIRYPLLKSPDKWHAKQKTRMELAFELFPTLKEAYGLANGLRALLRSRCSRAEAAGKLQQWKEKVRDFGNPFLISAMETIESREEHVLNYFVARSTNAAAESMNSLIKAFRSLVRGVGDPAFFMFRIGKIFGHAPAV